MIAPEEKPPVITHLVRLLKNQMPHADDDQVVIYNQAWKLPPDKRWYIVISYLAGAPYAFSLLYCDVPTRTVAGLNEYQTVNVKETYSITLFSDGSAARLLMNEIHFALNSDEAERLMGRHAFRIAKQPLSFTDVSVVEGTARLNRYDSTFNVLTVHTRTRNTLFYDKFTIPPEILVNA